MSNQVSTTSADEMIEMLSLLEEGYGASLHGGSASPGSTPRSDAATPTRQAEAMQRLRDLAKGVQSQFNYLMSYLKEDIRALGQSGSIDSALRSLFVRGRTTECDIASD